MDQKGRRFGELRGEEKELGKALSNHGRPELQEEMAIEKLLETG